MAKHRTASVSMGDVNDDVDLDAVIANGRHWAEQNYIFILTKVGFINCSIPNTYCSNTHRLIVFD